MSDTEISDYDFHSLFTYDNFVLHRRVIKSAVWFKVIWYFLDKKKSNLRVPSKRVAMVSKNVFWGAKSPFRVGIVIAYLNRSFDLFTAELPEIKKCFNLSC